MSKSDGPWGAGEREAGPAAEAPSAEPAADDSSARNPWLTPDEASTTPRRSANIEQIFRNLGNGGGGSPRPALNLRWLPWLGVGLLSAWLASTSVHVIQQDERALVTTMGRYTETLGPGLHVTMPWPIQAVAVREVGLEVTTSLPDKDAETLMPTRDGALIDLTFQLRWRVSDLRQFSTGLADPEAAIRRLADAEMRSAVAEVSFDDLISGKGQAALQSRVMSRVQAVLNAWHAGITVTGVELLRRSPPTQLAATFQKIATARTAAKKLEDDTLAWRGQQLTNTNIEVRDFNKIYAMYQIAPAVTRTKMYYETMERVLGNNYVTLGAATAGPNPAAPLAAPPPEPPPETAAKPEAR